jgi:hypothetical protein
VGKILLFYAFHAFLSILLFYFSENMPFSRRFTNPGRTDLLPRNRLFFGRAGAVLGLYSPPVYAFFPTLPLRFSHTRRPRRSCLLPRGRRNGGL